MASTIYIWMATSALLHLAAPQFLRFVQSQATLLLSAVMISLVVNIVVHGILQYQSCAGAFSMARVGKGAAIGTAITAAMAAIPIYSEGARRLVSELFIRHQPIQGVTEPPCATDCDKPPAPLELEAFRQQEFAEMRTGMSYWAAFAGAYGISIGGLFSATCGT
jgi:hypothetical protein